LEKRFKWKKSSEEREKRRKGWGKERTTISSSQLMILIVVYVDVFVVGVHRRKLPGGVKIPVALVEWKKGVI